MTTCLELNLPRERQCGSCTRSPTYATRNICWLTTYGNCKCEGCCGSFPTMCCPYRIVMESITYYERNSKNAIYCIAELFQTYINHIGWPGEGTKAVHYAINKYPKYKKLLDEKILVLL